MRNYIYQVYFIEKRLNFEYSVHACSEILMNIFYTVLLINLDFVLRLIFL